MTGELPLGRTAISEINDRLWEDHQRFYAHDLSGFEVEYVFLDAVYESLRRQGNRRTSERWWDVRMADLELALLQRLRHALDLDPMITEPATAQSKAA